MSDVTARFEAAVAMLISDGPVKKRLACAYAEYLEDLAAVDLPSESGVALTDLHRVLHCVQPVGRESAVQASVQKMSAHEAAGYAALILRLYKDVLTLSRRGDHLKVVASSEPPGAKAPKFLTAGS